MRFRTRSDDEDSSAEAAATAARLTRVVGPEPGVYSFEPVDGVPAAGNAGLAGAVIGVGLGVGASGGAAGSGVGAGGGAAGLGVGAGGGLGGAGGAGGSADPAAIRRALAALDPGRRAVRALAVLALVVA